MTRPNPHNPMLPFDSDKCQCKACGLYFNSTYAFDQHRKGPWDARRCLTQTDMQNAGWKVSPTGHWLTPSKSAGLWERLRQA